VVGNGVIVAKLAIIEEYLEKLQEYFPVSLEQKKRIFRVCCTGIWSFRASQIKEVSIVTKDSHLFINAIDARRLPFVRLLLSSVRPHNTVFP
jgi:hypothetical protein